VQPWSNGKIGLNGISYYGINQWQVASLQPPHLAALCIWEGAADWYRDMTHHGGMVSTFWANWYDMQVKTVQYGAGERGKRSRVHGELVCGPEILSEEQLAKNRCDFGADIRAHPLDDDYHKARTPQWDKITVPLFSAANWGGQGLHPRGNFEGFARAASKDKWLEAHGIEHWTHFYTDYGRELQRKFFDYVLKGEDTGWGRQPRVLLQVRHPGEKFVAREENEWPLAHTQWTKLYLDPSNFSLGEAASDDTKITFDALGEGVTFMTAPLETDTEITGPLAARLVVSSSTADADLFVILRVFSADIKEIVFQGAIDPHTPIAQGWLRASHRKLDPDLTLPYRPYHTHDEKQPLTPNVPVELDIELWPTSIVVPAGYRVALTIRGKDYEYGGGSGGRLSNFKNELKGCGPFLHDDPVDRPAEIFGGQTTLHFDRGNPSFVLLPVIPPM
jgi:predicted acyl esterase